MIACSKSDEILQEPQQANISTRSGNMASDPYRIEVMQKAINEITSAQGAEPITLKPTDKYVKFLPDSIDCQRLHDLNITIYPFRLDGQKEVVNADEDGFVHRPIVTSDGKAWRYCVVPIDYQFSQGTEYELIYNLFIQRKGHDSRAVNNQISDDIYKNVLLSSLSMTGNLPSSTWGEVEWKPSAKLTFDLNFKGDEDDEDDMRQVPAVGLKVSVRSCTHYGNMDINQDVIGTAYTDKNGETGTICTASGPIYYDIIYIHDKWQLKNGDDSSDTFVAQSTLPTYSPFNRNFKDGTLSNALAGVTRALHAYYYEWFQLTDGLRKHSKGFNVGCCDASHGNFG